MPKKPKKGEAQWMMFENDCCETCQHPKMCLITPREKALQVIVSCDCDETVYDRRWKAAKTSDELIVVVDCTVNEMLIQMAKYLGEQ